MATSSDRAGGQSILSHLRKAPARPLDAALRALRSGDGELCIRSLKETIESDPWGAGGWNDDDRERLRAELVLKRDAGDVGGAAEGLRWARTIWPDDASFATDLLNIYQNEEFGTSQGVRDLLQGLSEVVSSTPQNRVLIALLTARDGDASSARSVLRHLRGCRDEAFRPYTEELGQAVRMAFLTEANGHGLNRALAVEGLSIFFLHADWLGSLNMAVRMVGLVNTFGIEDPAGLTIEALQGIAPLLSIDGQTSLVAILTAFDRYHEARLLIDHLLENEQSRTSVLFAKSAVSHAMRTRAFALERHVLGRFVDSDPPAGDGLRRAQRREVINRRTKLRSDQPLNVFIGFFGQSRASDQVLPDTIRMLERDFAFGLGGPFNLHYGLSTWSRSGSRMLEQSHPANFFTQVLPPSAHPLLAARFGSTGTELSKIWPCTIATAIAFMNRKVGERISRATFEPILPSGSSVVIGDESELEDELQDALKAGPHTDIFSINQYKMWSRIAALKDAVLEQEVQSGRRIDACLLMRSDLKYLGGKPTNLICRVASEMEHKSVFCDHDPHAEYIEGAGDRYMACSREAADVLFSGYDYLLRATRGEDHLEDVIVRTTGHEGLHSLLFSNGLTVKPMTNIAYGLHRGSVPNEVLLPALREDAARTENPEHRALIDQVLRDLTVAP